jgi:hypothetical protein
MRYQSHERPFTQSRKIPHLLIALSRGTYVLCPKAGQRGSSSAAALPASSTRRLFLSALAPAATKERSASGTTHVREYTRKDGTVVRAHERSSRASTRKEPQSHPAASPGPSHTKAYCASCERNESGKIQRSASAKREFERANPCPATGRTSGSCSGYVIDHVKPLACGGADDPSNMQWQTVAEGKAKDRTERAGCR